jgi:phosphoglycolate phosphatase-like HAD superfamily hydrolase
MLMRAIRHTVRFALAAAVLLPVIASAQPAPLPSWNQNAVKEAILAFVEATTREGSPGFVPRAERIAVFDNDGTLWAEQPMYVQLAFALDRVKALASQHPEWKSKPPFSAVLAGDLKALAATGEKGIVELVMATHAGMSTEEFAKIVTAWLDGSRHPRFQRPYTEVVYQPMLELLAYLRQKGFKTYVVSGGGIEFMRPFTEKVYGIPPEQVIGSSIETQYEISNGKPVLMRLPKIAFIDDKAGKPVGIERFIGRRPLLAFGNSDGDQQMLEWTAAGRGSRLMGLVHHTDEKREYAYDRTSDFGRLDKALDEALAKGWLVVDMKRDWKKVFAFEP